MYGNVRSIVNKTRNIRILLTNHGMITEMGQCGPTEKSKNSGYIREMLTRNFHGLTDERQLQKFHGIFTDLRMSRNCSGIIMVTGHKTQVIVHV